MSPTPKQLGKRLKATRQAKDLTPTQLAQLAGVSRAYVYRLEAGQADPTVGMLQRLANALGVPVTELIRG